MNGLKTLPPTQFHDTINGLIAGLLKWQNNISKVQGKQVKTIGNSSRNHEQAMLIGLQQLPPEELEKVG